MAWATEYRAQRGQRGPGRTGASRRGCSDMEADHAIVEKLLPRANFEELRVDLRVLS
jgi:hypothetical protein